MPTTSRPMAASCVGNAHRCGVDEARVTRAGQLVRTLISAASRDDKTEEEATARFSAFFLVSAVADPKIDKLVASCKRITAELRRLESHQLDQALVGSRLATADGQDRASFGPGTASRPFPFAQWRSDDRFRGKNAYLGAVAEFDLYRRVVNAETLLQVARDLG